MVPTRPEPFPTSTHPSAHGMTSHLRAAHRLLLAGLLGAAAGGLGGCGNEADLEAPAPAPAPGSSKVVAGDGASDYMTAPRYQGTNSSEPMP